MKVKMIINHPGEGDFPTFPKGTVVTLKEACTHYLHWYACEIDGYQTYVPESFVSDGQLTREYNPTELVQEVGDVLEVREIVNAWLIATNENGVTGWIPAEAVVSVEAYTKQDMVKALQAITAMIERSEKALEKFAEGSSHHSLLMNRINALRIADVLISGNDARGEFTKDDYEKALAPIRSLISKSKKAQSKLKNGTWQYAMLEDNLKALYMALPLIEKKLTEFDE